MNEYRGWQIVDEMPEGWSIDKTCGSPLYGCVFITNGKSVLRGQQRKLLRVKLQAEGDIMPCGRGGDGK
jgi:hypothetical protein